MDAASSNGATSKTRQAAMMTTQPVRLRTEVTQVGRSVVLRLVGELDRLTAPAVGCLVAALRDGGDQDCVVDATSAFGADAADFALILASCPDREWADIRIVRR